MSGHCVWPLAAQAEARTLRRDLEGAASAREAALADARAQASASGAAAEAHAARAEGLSADVARLTADNAAMQARAAERGAAGSAADPQARLRTSHLGLYLSQRAAAPCFITAAALVAWRGAAAGGLTCSRAPASAPPIICLWLQWRCV